MRHPSSCGASRLNEKLFQHHVFAPSTTTPRSARVVEQKDGRQEQSESAGSQQKEHSEEHSESAAKNDV